MLVTGCVSQFFFWNIFFVCCFNCLYPLPAAPAVCERDRAFIRTDQEEAPSVLFLLRCKTQRNHYENVISRVQVSALKCRTSGGCGQRPRLSCFSAPRWWAVWFNHNNKILEHFLAIGNVFLAIQHLQPTLHMTTNLCSCSRNVKS